MPTDDEILAGVDGAPVLPGFTDFRLIGRGGFAAVYRARELAFARDVAVKVLSIVGMSSDTRRRFERECQAIGALSAHPNIVTVFGAGTLTDGRPYIVMDLMTGGSLSDRLNRSGPMRSTEVTAAALELAGAVQAAHEIQVLHRDIKPDNILISKYDRPQLADFGISSIPGGFETQSGAFTATIGYAAPEVIDGKRATPSSDVYSLAATLATMLVGKPLFARETDESVLALISRILQDPPPALQQFGASPQLETVLHRALAKTTDERYASAAQFAAELSQVPEAAGLLSPAPAAAVEPLVVRTDRDIAEPTQIRSRPHEPIENAPVSGVSLEEFGSRAVDPAHTAPNAGAAAGSTGLAGPASQPTVIRARAVVLEDDDPVKQSRLRSRRIGVIAVVALVCVAGGGTAFALRGGAHSASTPTKSIDARLATPDFRSSCNGLTCILTLQGSLASGETLRWRSSHGTIARMTATTATFTYPRPGAFSASVTAIKAGTRPSEASRHRVRVAALRRRATLREAAAGSRHLILTVAAHNPLCRSGRYRLQGLHHGTTIKPEKASVGPSGTRTIRAPLYRARYRVVVDQSPVVGGICMSARTRWVSVGHSVHAFVPPAPAPAPSPTPTPAPANTPTATKPTPAPSKPIHTPVCPTCS